MIANVMVDEDVKILISNNCASDAIPDFDFVTSDESHTETPQRASLKNHINAPVIKTVIYHINTTVVASHKTPRAPINSDKLDEVKVNMVPLKSFFMN